MQLALSLMHSYHSHTSPLHGECRRTSMPALPRLPGADDRRSRTGRKGNYAHYYVQLSPGETFVGK